MVEFMLAAVLLLGDPEQTHLVEPELYHQCRLELQILAEQWQLLDSREIRYVLARPEDFHSDLGMLRRRNKELQDAPAVEDAMRFPERSHVNDLLSFNRAYRQHLDIRLPGEPARWLELKTALQETDRLYAIWDTVRDARCEYYYVTVRRQALKRLREQIGYDDYYSGKLPPWVPVWRFQEIR